MKQKTKLAIEHIIDHLEMGIYAEEGFCIDVTIVCELLRKLPAIEEALASGGLVKDDKGNWLKDGDKVKYREKRNDELHIGTVNFDKTQLCWYLITDDENFPMLARDFGLITYFEKA